MLRKIGLTLLLSAATMAASTAYAMKSNALQAGMSVEYELVPNDPQMFVNYLFWSIKADCKISTQDTSDVLFAEVIAKTGTINGVNLKKGDTLQVTVHQGEVLKLSADAGAQVKITNLGQNTVKTTCVA